MKVAQFSDLHYAPGNLAEADRCFTFAVSNAIDAGAQIGIVTGDSTDHRLDAHSPALNALATQIHRLAGSMPVVMLQGTFSHEPPGTLDNFALMGARHEVYVADRVHQVAFVDGRFISSAGAVFSPEELQAVIATQPEIVFTCLPTVNKGQLAASVGAFAAGTGLGDVLAAFLAAAGRVNAQLRDAKIPTAGLSHGTVNGCVTEHGVTMAGFDHEFSLGTLLDAQCDAFMLGHIHKHQSWSHGGRRVAYPGSIGRFHYGEKGAKGYLLWRLSEGGSAFRHVPVPARETVSIEFDGPPDMAELERLAAQSSGAFVRVRWQVDEEHRQSVDRNAIEAMFSQAAGLKVEPRVLPVVRSRAQGISLETTVEGKVARWCAIAEVAPEPIVERLQLLHSGDAETVAAQVLSRLDQLPAPEPSLAMVIDNVANEPTSLAEVVPDLAAQAALTPVASSTQSESLSWLTDDLFAA